MPVVKCQKDLKAEEWKKKIRQPYVIEKRLDAALNILSHTKWTQARICVIWDEDIQRSMDSWVHFTSWYAQGCCDVIVQLYD